MSPRDFTPAALSGDARVSYASIVAAQLGKNRLAMLALRFAICLLAAAVVAPLLAFNVPLLWVEGGSVSFPLLGSLFDRFLFPSGVDLFFNLLLLTLPAWLLTRAVVRTRARRQTAPFAASVLGLALVGLYEVAAVLGGRTATAFAVLGTVLPGAALVLWLNRAPAGSRARLRRRAALVGLFLAGFAGVLILSDTRPWKDWKAVQEDPARADAILAVFPPSPYHPSNVGESQLRSTERVLALPSARYWLGCDTQGRDVFTRLLFGTRISLTIGLVAVGLYVLIGIFFGGLAGYFGGWVDLTISRLIEVMICFPTLFLILTIIAVFETRSIFLIMGAIGFVGWPGVARLVRGEFLRQRNLDYVTAAKAQGLPERRILFRHVLPNCLGPVLVSATFGIAGAILTESGLAFLGLGDKSAPSWGEMLTNGRVSLAWHLILVPGFAIFFVVTVFNLLGEGLRDALDPKLRR